MQSCCAMAQERQNFVRRRDCGNSIVAAEVAATLVRIAEGCRPQKAGQLPAVAPIDHKAFKY